LKRINKSNIWRAVILISIILYLISAYPEYRLLPELSAKATIFFLNLFGVESVIQGGHIFVESITEPIWISIECSGLFLILIFIIIMQLGPEISFSHRILSLALIPFLFFGNVLRLFFGIILGLNFGVNSLIFFHRTIGQVFIFIWAIFLYILFLKLIRKFPQDIEKKLNEI